MDGRVAIVLDGRFSLPLPLILMRKTPPDPGSYTAKKVPYSQSKKCRAMHSGVTRAPKAIPGILAIDGDRAGHRANEAAKDVGLSAAMLLALVTTTP